MDRPGTGGKLLLAKVAAALMCGGGREVDLSMEPLSGYGRWRFQLGAHRRGEGNPWKNWREVIASGLRPAGLGIRVCDSAPTDQRGPGAGSR